KDLHHPPLTYYLSLIYLYLSLFNLFLISLKSIFNLHSFTWIYLSFFSIRISLSLMYGSIFNPSVYLSV
ncbi:hypothetical protein CSUI_009509, partial [Cystoisospora suis]